MSDHRLVNNPNAVYPCSQCGEPSQALAAGHDLPPSLAKLPQLAAAIFVQCANCGVRLAEPECNKPKRKRKGIDGEVQACFDEDRRRGDKSRSSSSSSGRRKKPKPMFRPDQEAPAPWGDDSTSSTELIETKDHTMKVRLPLAQFRLMKALAKSRGKTVSQLIREAAFELLRDDIEGMIE